MANENESLTPDGLAAMKGASDVKSSIGELKGVVEDGITPSLEDLNSKVDPLIEDVDFIAKTFEDLKTSLDISVKSIQTSQEKTLLLTEDAQKIENKAKSVKKAKPNLSDVAQGGLQSLGPLLLYDKLQEIHKGISDAEDTSSEQRKGILAKFSGFSKDKKNKEGKSGNDKNKIGSMMESFAKTIKTTVSDGFKLTIPTVKGTFEKIGSVFTSGLDKISAGIVGKMENLTSGIVGMFKQFPALVLGFFGKVRSFFSGIFKKKDDGGGNGKSSNVQHVLVLASNTKNVKDALAGYESIIKAASSSKKISIKSLQKLQENLDDFVKTLADNGDKDKKKFSSAKKYIQDIADVIGTFAHVAIALAKIALFAPVFIAGTLTAKAARIFFDSLSNSLNSGLFKRKSIPQAKRILKHTVDVLGLLVEVGKASAKIAVFGTVFLVAWVSLKTLGFFFSGLNGVLNKINDSKVDFKSVKKTIAAIKDALIDIVMSAVIVMLSAPLVLGGIIGLLPMLGFIAGARGLIKLAGSIDRKVLNNAITTVNIMFMFASSMIITSLAFAALLIITPFAALSLFYLKDLTRDFIGLIERLDNNNLKKVRVAVANILLMTTFATLYLAFTMILALTTPFAILAGIGLIVMIGIGLLINIVGNVFTQALKSVLAIIVVSISMVVMALAVTATVILLAIAGKTIMDNKVEILAGFVAMALLVGVIALVGAALQSAMGAILAAILAFAAVALFAFAAEYAIDVFSNITIDSIIAACQGVGKFMILFAVITVAGGIAFAALGPIACLTVASLLILGAAAAMIGSISLLSKMDVSEVDAAADNLRQSKRLFKAAALAGIAALIAVPGAAAILVVSVALLPASVALLGTTKALSSKNMTDNILASSGNMAISSLLFMATALAGTFALLAVPGAAAILATSIILLPASLALAGSINVLAKTIDSQSIIQAATVMKEAKGFFGAAALAGFISLVALPGLAALAISSTLLLVASVPLSKAAVAISKIPSLDAAKVSVKNLKDIIGQFGKMGRSMLSAKDFFNAVEQSFGSSNNEVSDALSSLTNTISRLSSLKIDENSPKEVSKLGKTIKSLGNLGKIDVSIFNNLSSMTEPLGDFLSSLEVSFKSLKAAKNELSVDDAAMIKQSLNEISKINTKDFSEFASELFRSALKLDPVAKSINKVSDSIRGLNTELQALNQQGNAVKIFSQINASDGTAMNSTPDAKAKVFEAGAAHDKLNNASIKQTLSEIKDIFDKFTKTYEKTNRQTTSSWKSWFGGKKK